MAALAQNARRDPVFVGRIEKRFPGFPSIASIEEWVRDRFAYQSELFELVRAPQYMLEDIVKRGWFSGDCDDVATFLAAILKVFDYPAEFVAIRSQTDEFEHVFVRSDNLILDPTVAYGTSYSVIEHMIEKV